MDRARQDLLGEPNREILSVEDQPKEDKDLVSYIQTKTQEIRNSSLRISLEAIWLTNAAYVIGYDSVVFDASSRQFVTTDQTPRFNRKNRIHKNKILPNIQNRLARLCKNPPRYDVIPASASQEDKDGARLAKQVLTMLWDKEQINRKRIDLYMLFQQYGDSYVKVYWDPEKGKDLPSIDGNQEGKEGDITVEIVSPFEIFPDPLAKSLDECRYIVHAKTRPLDYFRERYELGHLVKEEDAWLLSMVYQDRINTMTNKTPGGPTNSQQLSNSAIELVYYEKPSTKHPKGRMVICANGVKLADKELPIDEIPISKFSDIIVGGRFHSESTVTHLRPLQDQQNKNLYRRAQWVNRLLAGKYTVPRGHGLTTEALNDQSGEVLEYNVVPNAVEGGRPTPLNVPNIPSYIYKEEEELDRSFNEIIGISEISKGQLPSAGIPAIGMQFLQEQDETRIGVVTENNEFSWASVGRIILKFVACYYKTPRMLKIAGKGEEYNFRKFVGDDLKDNFDVIVVRGSTLPNSKVLKRQEIVNAWQIGMLGNPQDPKVSEKVLSMMEYGDVSQMWEDIAADMTQINSQIDMIERGEQPEVNELDNHSLHIQEKNRYRKSDKFKSLSPKAQQILLADIEFHVQELVNIENPNMDQEMEMAKTMNAQTDQISQEQTQETENQLVAGEQV